MTFCFLLYRIHSSRRRCCLRLTFSKMKLSVIVSLVSLILPTLVTAQLSGSVGPSTSTAYKQGLKTCNILDYGGVASATADNGPAIAAAWAACKGGGEGLEIATFLYLRSLLTLYSCNPRW
jgi:rhamnogalacturonan hydrolase